MTKKSLIKGIMLFLSVFILTVGGYAQQKIGNNKTTNDPSAFLELESTNSGFLPPRMTTVQRNAITSPATGLIIYNTTLSCLQVNDGTPAVPVWNCISGVPAVPFALNCAGATFSPSTFTSGSSYTGTLTVPYTGGNGTAYSATSANSTIVTGLTASLAAGTLANGAGSLVYNVTGTPANPGAAQFLISLNGQSCTKSASISAVGLSGCPAGTVVSFTPCSGLAGATLNDNPATTLSVEYDWTQGSTQMRGSSNTRALLEIGGQCWFARDAIAPCATGNCPTLTTDGARLYSWTAAMGGSTTERAQGVCPAGFHIPSNCEFAYLTLAAGSTVAELNTTFSSGGSTPVNSVAGRFHAAQSNLTGWSATFRGWESTAGSGSITGVGTYDDYWTSTTNPSVSTEARAWTTISPNQWSAWPWAKTAGYQVRCIRD